MDPLTFFGFISSACSIASFLISSDLKATTQTVRGFLSKIPENYRDDISSEEGLKLVNLLIIDPELLDDLTDDVHNYEKDYRRCLRRGKSPQERDRCDRRAERGICETLNRIMDKNEEEIPTEYLRTRWSSHRCVRY